MSTSVETATLAGNSIQRPSSYGQILKSSSIAAGAQAISLMAGLARTKLVAVLLGPAGVGLIGLYESILNLMGTLTGLGVRTSAVRQVAEAHGSGDAERLGRTIAALRRMSWATGLFGVALTVFLARPLSQWAFGHGHHAIPVAILGNALLLTALANGQSALVQGMRQIGNLAHMQILSALAALVISAGFYTWLGEQGIVPVFLGSAGVTLGFSWWFARRIKVYPAVQDWQATLREGWQFVRLGMAFVISGLVLSGVELAARAWILRDFGVEANGLYQAAWSISGAFAGFILSAMAKDFYPRLTTVAKDNKTVTQLVTEQTEIGILLALPGLLATVVFSPWIIQVLYSQKFEKAADLLPWFVLGLLGRVISWPLGFIQLAKGAAGWFVATEVVFHTLHLFFIWLGLRWVGLPGVAMAFAALYACYTVGMLWVAKRLVGFAWTKAVKRLLMEAVAIFALTFFLVRCVSGLAGVVLGAILVVGSGLLCLRRICDRLGREHRVSRLAKCVLQPQLIVGRVGQGNWRN